MTRRTALLLCSALLLAACSDDSSGSNTTTAASAPSTAAAETTATLPAAPPTIDDLLALGRPLVLAHTAGEDASPASTMFGFAESVKAGVDLLDLNVILSKDGVLMVQHDETVDGSTEGTGAVADHTAAELSALDDAYWFTLTCGVCHDRPEGEYIYRSVRTGDRPAPDGYTADDFAMPTLEQVLLRFPSMPLGIEIKGNDAPARAAADELARLLQQYDMTRSVVVSSFDDAIVSYFHGLLPDVEMSPAIDAITAWVLGRTPLPDGMRILQLPPDFDGIEVITPELVADSTAAGYPIWVWPNSRDLEHGESYLAFLQEGVVGLNINRPIEGVAAVQQFVAASTVAPLASKGCTAGATITPGDTTLDLTAAELPGSFVRHVPASYDGTTPMPLVLDLHGWSEPAAVQAVFSGLGTVADEHGFITIAPEITRPVALWNAALDGADLEWISALLDEAEATMCIDIARLYVAGISNGAMMTSSIACALSDRIAAVAPVAGVRDPKGCTTSRAVPMIAFHGTADDFLSYEGGYGPAVASLPAPDGNGTLGDLPDDVLGDATDAMPVIDRADAWSVRNGCDGIASITVIDDVERRGWACPADGDTVLWTVNGGGHTWPGSAFGASAEATVGHTTTTISASELMWAFFAAHPLPS